MLSTNVSNRIYLESVIMLGWKFISNTFLAKYTESNILDFGVEKSTHGQKYSDTCKVVYTWTNTRAEMTWFVMKVRKFLQCQPDVWRLTVMIYLQHDIRCFALDKVYKKSQQSEALWRICSH